MAQPIANCSRTWSRVVGGGYKALAIGCRSPLFHHWFSKPLSTVIIAEPSASSSRTRSGSSLRYRGDSMGDSIWTTVGLVGASSEGCGTTWLCWGSGEAWDDGGWRKGSGSMYGSQPTGTSHDSQGMPSSPSLKRDGTSGKSFQTSETGRSAVA